jgi:DUF4097 and DUF4098 domain-containing protein YvlB
MKPAILACAVALLGCASAGCVVSVDSQGQIVRDEKRFKVAGTPDVRVSTYDGSIAIQSWDRPDVMVEVEKRGATREAVDAIRFDTSQDGNRIEIDVKGPQRETFTGFGLHGTTSARLTLFVPERLNVVARSGDGSIRAERLNGRLELRTGDGSIRASHLSGEIVLNTGDGSVVVEGGEGRLKLETGDGGVTVSGRFSALKMHTVDGSIVCRAEAGTTMSDDWEITTGDGAVSLYLPASFSAHLDAHTGDGSIRHDLPIDTEALERDDDGNRDRDRRTVRARLGDGGRLLRIRTGDGGIRLKTVN